MKILGVSETNTILTNFEQLWLETSRYNYITTIKAFTVVANMIFEKCIFEILFLVQ